MSSTASWGDFLGRNPYEFGQKSASKIGSMMSFTAICAPPARGWGGVGFLFQVWGQSPQKRFYPDPALYGLEADPVDAGTASVGTDQPPGVGEYLGPSDLVVE